MPDYTLLTSNDFVEKLWKNGQGKTTELLCENVTDEHRFIWRLSIAEVSTNGLFSDFSGYQRTLLLIEGNGIVLTHNDDQVDTLNKLLDVSQFDGGCVTESKLIDGPIKDFNIMTSADKCASKVLVLRDSGSMKLASEADHVVIYSLSDEASIAFDSADQEVALRQGNLLHIYGNLPKKIRVKGSPLICIQISYLN